MFSKKNKNKKVELIKFNPKSFYDSKEMARQLKEGNVLLVNFDSVSNNEILRIIDFISGTLYVLKGKYKKISPKVYLLSPSDDLLEKFSNEV